MNSFLQEQVEKFGISISENQLVKFQKYYEYLIEINQVMNLTAITDEKEVVMKHFLDSISILKYDSMELGIRVIDVGTGAGFPGVPLAIMCPDVSFTLMDSLNKRIRFLNQLFEKCEITNVRAIHARAEELGHDPDYREQFDICVSRAVANLPVLLEYCIPFLKKGGRFISYKSMLAQEELNESQNAQNKLCCKLKNQTSFELGEYEYHRSLLIFEKYDQTSKKYPRQNGIPKKKPL